MHDVGQGTAVLLRTARHALWYDVGPPIGGEGSERVLVPSLRALGQARPDRVLISHDDLDHAGNLPSLRLQLPELPLLAPPGSTIAGAGRCQRGLRWRWDGVDFQVLHPDAGSQRAENEDSCVLRVASAHGGVLLPGDITPVEQALLRASPSALKADVVLVPHHGSGGSSSAPWVAAVSARLALVSVGHQNRFGHPRRDVVRRWQAQEPRWCPLRSPGRSAYGLAHKGCSCVNSVSMHPGGGMPLGGRGRLLSYRRSNKRIGPEG